MVHRTEQTGYILGHTAHICMHGTPIKLICCKLLIRFLLGRYVKDTSFLLIKSALYSFSYT